VTVRSAPERVVVEDVRGRRRVAAADIAGAGVQIERWLARDDEHDPPTAPGYARAVLDRVTVESFALALGEPFVLEHEAVDRLDLAEASTLTPDAPAVDAGGRRTPFRLVFRGPADPVLEQRIYRLRHKALGTLEIFIVPIGRGEYGTEYEAIFT
jgi:hypothetical protein